MSICVQYTLVNKYINDRAYIYKAGTKKQPAAVPAPQVITAPTLGLSGLSDGCIDTIIFDLTMGGDGPRWVVQPAKRRVFLNSCVGACPSPPNPFTNPLPSHKRNKNRSDDAVRHDHPLFPGGVRVVKIAGAGHFLHQEKPEEVNALLLDWFGRHEGAGAGE